MSSYNGLTHGFKSKSRCTIFLAHSVAQYVRPAQMKSANYFALAHFSLLMIEKFNAGNTFMELKAKSGPTKVDIQSENFTILSGVLIVIEFIGMKTLDFFSLSLFFVVN